MPRTLVSTNASRPWRRDMRLVQRRRVQDRPRRPPCARATSDRSAIEPTTSVNGPGTTSSPTASRPALAQRAHQRFAEMPRTSGDENGHGGR